MPRAEPRSVCEQAPGHAELLARRSKWQRALEVATGLGGSAEVIAKARVIAASAARELGQLDQAEEMVNRGVMEQVGPSVRARLLCIRSDLHLLRGDHDTARSAALEAVHAAKPPNHEGPEGPGPDPQLFAEALSRVAAARALGGDPLGARTDYANALEAAEAAGKVGDLPPYLMNLATAEHAVGELARAIRLYERAAHVAERFGREASRAAALTNMAGLLVTVGAVEEARQILRDANASAEAAGSHVYLAQAKLIEAEALALEAPGPAVQIATEAREAFEAYGATRQALEARLLEAELAALAGDSSGASLCRTHRAELQSAGLGVRGCMLAARAAMLDADLQEALRWAEPALEQAQATRDRPLVVKTLHLLAAIHDRLGTGGDEALRTRAREAMGEVAARLPSGLRQRYLARTAATATPPSEPQEPRRDAMSEGALRLLDLVRRVLLEEDERRLLEAALDEAVALTRAERAFLLRDRPDRRPEVVAARNLDKETVQRSQFRYSRSVAEQVLRTGELLLIASAHEDPALSGARSIHDLGVRSILCVPIRGPSGVIAALYLDHRFETGRFEPEDTRLVRALGDIIGVTLENARLHREANRRERELERSHERMKREAALQAAEVDRLATVLAHSSPAEDAAEVGIVGSSPPLRYALDTARRVAPSELSVLIEGESGTGKELFARFIHARSRRPQGPFVAINCGALPENLLESELFGHVRGAFTGATHDHAGLFRSASGGTLLLDEIGEVPVRMQTRLLRVLQEREVRPVGGGSAVAVDVRIIAATNRDLDQRVKGKHFRQDLFYRLAGVRIVLPPLRERRDDLPELAHGFVSRIAEEHSTAPVHLSRDALQAIFAYDWPGNVRELEQTLRRAVLMTDGDRVSAADLGLGGFSMTRRKALRGFDRGLVEQALRSTGGNRTRAARVLGISRATLHRWMNRYAIR